MHTTGRSIRFSSCHSQLAMAPVSKPIRTASGARLAISLASAPGSERALPSKTMRPLSSITHTAVSFCDTSNPTYCFMIVLSVATTSKTEPIGSRRFGGKQPRRNYTMFPRMPPVSWGNVTRERVGCAARSLGAVSRHPDLALRGRPRVSHRRVSRRCGRAQQHALPGGGDQGLSGVRHRCHALPAILRQAENILLRGPA